MSSFVNHKLRAFTLLELLAGIVVSGIVLAATFAAYHIVSRQTGDFEQRSKAAAELSFFTSRFASDFARPGILVRISESEISLRQEERTLNYHFSEKYILRTEQLHTDTFFVAVKTVETFYENEKTGFENAEADQVRFVLSVDERPEEKIYSKLKDAKAALDKQEQQLETE